MSALLTFENLGRRYGSHWALESVTGTLKAGELTALTGENGSGKSTLLLVLANILKPHRGRISAASGVRTHLVSHYAMAYPQLTVCENLNWAAALDPATGDVSPALDYWQIAALAEKPVNTLSRGQLQRFLLARAMLADAKVLLLDEPFTGLDSEGEKLLIQFMRSEAKMGKAILFSEHDARRAKQHAHRALRMASGRCAK